MDAKCILLLISKPTGLLVLHVYAVMWSLYAVGHTYMQYGRLFAQGHTSLLRNVCLPVLVVTLLIALSCYDVYILA